MQAASRTDYWHSLKREFNPTIFETEWLSLQVWEAEVLLDSSTNELIAGCIEGIEVFLEARNMGREVLAHIVAASDADDSVKAGFWLAQQDPESFNTQIAPEELCRFAIYCYLRVAYTYEWPVVG